MDSLVPRFKNYNMLNPIEIEKDMQIHSDSDLVRVVAQKMSNPNYLLI